ncbi:MAG: hypothetical protein JO000_03785 [Alphaproteobacteria bacterium]|nr:hypothetical protein [Alphaproteobacteria bacterium]
MPEKSQVLAFDPTAIPGLSNKAREAVTALFQAIAAWQEEIANLDERHTRHVLDRMATAAAALGWPKQIVDAARTQMQSITEVQRKAMEQIRGAWEEQLKLPNPTAAAPDAMLSKLKSMPGFGAVGGWPNADAFQSAATAPLAFWMDCGKQWQKFWTDSLEQSTKAFRLSS